MKSDQRFNFLLFIVFPFGLFIFNKAQEKKS